MGTPSPLIFKGPLDKQTQNMGLLAESRVSTGGGHVGTWNEAYEVGSSGV